MRFANIPNYLSNSAAAVGKFGSEFSNYLEKGLTLGRGASGPRAVYGGIKEAAQYASQGNLPLAAATGALDVLTDASRGAYWFLNHTLAVGRNVGRAAGEKMGLDPITTDLLGRSTPFAIAALGGAVGNPLQGARPAGFKSILPVSKEEDPTGRTSANPLAESVLRYFTGRRGDPLPYSTFKEERPEIAYPTYQEYLRYKHMKPDGFGKIDPQGQSFVGPLGIIRGTAKGLNEPEIQYFGFPVTASTALGTAAALGTTGALHQALPEKLRFAQTVMARTPEAEEAVKRLGREIAVEKAGIPIGKGTQGGVSYLTKLMEDIGQKEAIGAPKLATAAGLVAAGLGVGYLTKKAVQAGFNKQAEERLKKEQPVEYLKHKYGSFQSASELMEQPTARSWEELTPYMN